MCMYIRVSKERVAEGQYSVGGGIKIQGWNDNASALYIFSISVCVCVCVCFFFYLVYIRCVDYLKLL